MKENSKLAYNLIMISLFIPIIILALIMSGMLPINIATDGAGQESIRNVVKNTSFQSKYAICSICLFAFCFMIRIITIRGKYKGVYLKDTKNVIEPIFAERIIDSVTNPANLILAELVELIKKGFVKINELGNISILSTNVKDYDNTVDYHFIDKILRSPSLKRLQNKGISSVAFNNYISGVATNENDAYEFNLLDKYIDNTLYENHVYKVILNHLLVLLRVIVFALSVASFGIILINRAEKMISITIMISIVLGFLVGSESIETELRRIGFAYDLKKYKRTDKLIKLVERVLMIILFVAIFLTIRNIYGNGLYFGIGFFLNLASWLLLKNVVLYTELGKKVHMNARILYNFLSERAWTENEKLDVDTKYDYIAYALAFGFSIEDILERTESFKDIEIVELKKFLKEVNDY